MGFERWARLVREYTQQQAPEDSDGETVAKANHDSTDQERQHSTSRATGIQKGTDEGERS